MPGKLKGVIAVILAIILLVLPYLQPALQSFMDPVHGVAGASLSAGQPSGIVLKAPGVPGRAVITWDGMGVPHINATTDAMGFYAVGWVTASQRLFQMDVLRRIPEGRLAALVGEKGVKSDIFMLQSGIARSVELSWDMISNSSDPVLKGTARMLEYYSMGVNAYIRYAEKHNMLPLEYRVLGRKPEPWTPKDTIAVAKLIAYGLAWNDGDLIMQELVDKYGDDGVYLARLFGIPYWNGTLAQADCRYAVMWSNVTGITRLPVNATAFQPYVPGRVEHVNVTWLVGLTEYPARLIGLPSPGIGASNNWVINGSYTASGKPIVANDPHLELTMPPIWFMVVLNTPSYHVVGNLFPGTPLVVIGRNQHMAWGFTNVMGDFTDYYYYKWENGRYLYKGRWLEPIHVETVTLKIWDPVKRTYTTRTVNVERTVHGYLIRSGGHLLAVRWTGQDPSAEIAFFYLLDKASTVREALQAQRYFHVPPQNFVVADDKGNFAYSLFGAYPVRTNLPVYNVSGVRVVNTGWLPFNGSAGEGEWVGYVPPDRIPILYDPDLPFIATANSKPFNGTCGLFIGWHYHDKYRLMRIEQLLTAYIASGRKISVQDVMKVQTDIVDLGVRDYLSLLFNLTCWKSYEPLVELHEWMENNNTIMAQDAWQPTLAAAWIAEFHLLLWKSLYGSTEHVTFLRQTMARNLINAYLSGDPIARKLLASNPPEELALKAYKRAVANLTKYYASSDPHSWVYGRIHYYNLHHLAFNVLNAERLPASGFIWTINVAPSFQVNTGTGMPVGVGPSLREIIDLSRPDYYIALPGGENGNPFSAHYQDFYLKYWYWGYYADYNITGPVQGPSMEIVGSQG